MSDHLATKLGKVSGVKVAHYPQPHSPEKLDELRRLAPGWTIEAGPPDDSTQVLISGRATTEQLAAAGSLKAIIVPWAGVPPQLRNAVRDFPGVAIHNLHHNAPETAEVAMALLLACAKSVVPIDQALRVGDWTPGYKDRHSIRLEGKTAVVLGFGAIGQRIARACVGLGMRVRAHRRNVDQPLRTEVPVDDVEVRGPHDLSRSLIKADVLILAMPQTDETTGLIGPTELAMMNDGAILVNIARGNLVDEDALYEALASGKLRAAGLDVWYRYPEPEEGKEVPDSAKHTFPANRPFHELPNVVLSPHRGGSSIDVEQARIEAIAHLLNSDPMPNRVDLDRGY